MSEINQIIYTNKARCRDCYRCVRACPVNAIKMETDQASVVDDRCILCGTCIRECPQEAKTYRKDLYKVKKLIEENGQVVASIAPSFAFLFNEWEIKRIPSMLRMLGFSQVFETAEGAYYVAQKSSELFDESPGCSITTACPAVINYVERYESKKVKNLMPVLSPMSAHGKIIKERLGFDTKVVFIGPCIAKKDEAERPESEDYVDAVITFDELLEWVKEENISLNDLEDSSFDSETPYVSRYFPLAGGLPKTADITPDLLSETIISVTGHEEVFDSLANCNGSDCKTLVEPLFCRYGCINGPGVTNDENIFSRRKKILDYTKSCEQNSPESLEIKTNLSNTWIVKKLWDDNEFSEEEIRIVLEQTGKVNEEDQLNCKACGYDSCIDKAKAVLNGMAVKEMCIPFMRRMAEQRTDKVINTSPNGIIILDQHFNIMHMNPAFKNFFHCTNNAIGKKISTLMDPEPFIQLKNSEEKKISMVIKHSNNLICHQIIYTLEEDNQIAGIFVDITKHTNITEKFTSLKKETIYKAQELLDHQIAMAQNLAKYLGESTAKGEELVENLIELTEDEEKKNLGSKKNWLWNTRTPK